MLNIIKVPSRDADQQPIAVYINTDHIICFSASGAGRTFVALSNDQMCYVLDPLDVFVQKLISGGYYWKPEMAAEADATKS